MLETVDPKYLKELDKFQEKIGYSFNDINLLIRALTHRSFLGSASEKNDRRHNERLEFLGDSVLGLVITDYLFNKYKNMREGALTKIKSFIVSRDQVGSVARRLKLERIMFFADREKSKSKKITAQISNAFEALIGAIYLDAGIEKARTFIMNQLSELLASLELDDLVFDDYKSIVQQIAQKEMQVLPVYNLIKEKGPEHNKTFVVQLEIDGQVISRGSGRSKKRAEQRAAEKAYKSMRKRSRTLKILQNYIKTLKKSK